MKIASMLSTALLMAVAARGSMPSEYKCNGNEPFWGLAIDNDHAGWATPDEPEGRTLEGTFQHLDYADLFSWRGSFGDGDLVAFVNQRSCSDTMADRDYPFSIIISLPDGSVLLGCCDTSSEPRTETQSETSSASLDEPITDNPDENLAELPIAVLENKPPGDWSRHLLELLPAIEACIAKTPGSSPRVAKAWSVGNGSVGVRTSNAQAANFECLTSARGSVVELFTALTGEAPRAHDGWSPLFTPSGQHPPAGECYQHERVVAAGGALIGWLSYDTC